LFVVVLAILILSKRIDYVNEVDAKFIGNNSVLYIITGCSHCLKQEELFGDNVKYLNIVNCIKEENKQECIDSNIRATPTWIINGEKYVGYKTLKELKMIFINHGIGS
jgi:glutaredoxin